MASLEDLEDAKSRSTVEGALSRKGECCLNLITVLQGLDLGGDRDFWVGYKMLEILPGRTAFMTGEISVFGIGVGVGDIPRPQARLKLGVWTSLESSLFLRSTSAAVNCAKESEMQCDMLRKAWTSPHQGQDATRMTPMDKTALSREHQSFGYSVHQPLRNSGPCQYARIAAVSCCIVLAGPGSYALCRMLQAR